MTFQVLQSWAENRAARAELDRRGLSFWPRVAGRGVVDRVLRRRPVVVGEYNKSWDVLRCIEEIERRLTTSDLVVDLGAYASEVPCALHQAGFRNVVGIDLNPDIARMPYGRAIRWQRGDMTRTSLASASAGAVVALSSLEHGDYDGVLREAARLLRAGGLFVGSTDYWPDKIDTSNVTMFGMSWRIFSTDEIRAFFAHAASLGLRPTGPLHFNANERCIDCADRLYTFGWFSFTKDGP